MHPDIMRDLVRQHGHELREQAHRATLARTASKARRAARHSAYQLSAGQLSADQLSAEHLTAEHLTAEPVIPAVPDYVDGTFRSARDEATGQVPAARRAA